MALKFAAEKYKVALVSRRPASDLEEEVRSRGGEALAVVSDAGLALKPLGLGTPDTRMFCIVYDAHARLLAYSCFCLLHPYL